jgi:HEAT repeat protein
MDILGCIQKLVPVVPEDLLFIAPREKDGSPKLRYFTKPLEHYIGYFEDYLAIFNSQAKLSSRQISLACSKGSWAQWGFIAKGTESLPYVMELLKRPIPEAREAAANVLFGLARQDGVIEPLLDALATEDDEQTRGGMIQALGALRSKKAIPVLAQLIRDQKMDEENRWVAMESLGEIVGRMFVRQDSPIKAAEDWLTKHGY